MLVRVAEVKEAAEIIVEQNIFSRLDVQRQDLAQVQNCDAKFKISIFSKDEQMIVILIRAGLERSIHQRSKEHIVFENFIFSLPQKHIFKGLSIPENTKSQKSAQSSAFNKYYSEWAWSSSAGSKAPPNTPYHQGKVPVIVTKFGGIIARITNLILLWFL